jgi:branched-subunit amino acid aminotransferase/4-amino-4-deoxychorismate lyase
MSLFESVAVAGGVVEFWAQHHQRLLTACIERDFAVNEKALGLVEETLSYAEIDGFGRIYVTAGDGGPAAPVDTCRIYLFIEERRRPQDESWGIGIHEEPWQPIFPGLKTANYWAHCEALASAKRRKFEEALLFNDHAELVSGCCANVFLVHGDKIATPSRGSGCRPGVVREWVLKRRKVEERRLRREDVLAADEIFLTNSWIGVMPVATLEGRPLERPNVTSRLVAEWERRRSHDG